MLLVIGLLSSGALLAASKGPDVTTRAYSIFDGTMVDMTYPEIEKAAQEKAIVLFPTGVIEEHGPALPLGVDTYEAYVKAKLLKAELEKKGIRVLIAPPCGVTAGAPAGPGRAARRRPRAQPGPAPSRSGTPAAATPAACP